MKKEDSPNSQGGAGSSDNKEENRNQQKNQKANISNTQQNDITRQAGLGRNRMVSDIKDMGGMSGRDNCVRSNSDDLQNEDLNAANDQ